MLINTITIEPPIFNSSSLWASSCQQLDELYSSPWTGAVTTRTSTLEGFKEDPQIHRHAFLDGKASINSYGYSPHPFRDYLNWVLGILEQSPMSTKLFILSIAPSDVLELTQMLDMIRKARLRIKESLSNSNRSRIGVELNTSCPNILGRPPAYDPKFLIPFLNTLKTCFVEDNSLTIGLKLAPFVHCSQFEDWVRILTVLAPTGENEPHCISFLSCTNTLGSNFMFSDQESLTEALKDSLGLTGGLAGNPIHTLSLGNIRMFKQLLSEHPSPSLQRIHIIGIGGVVSKEARERMVKAGASAVACATALGIYGIGVFRELL